GGNDLLARRRAGQHGTRRRKSAALQEVFRAAEELGGDDAAASEVRTSARRSEDSPENPRSGEVTKILPESAVFRGVSHLKEPLIWKMRICARFGDFVAKTAIPHTESSYH